MAWDSGARQWAQSGARCSLLGLVTAVATLTITSDAANARRHHGASIHYVHYSHSRHHAHSEEGAYDPPGSSIVVDGNSGAVLEASNPDALRHPASLTKVMTLYLLFDRLDVGKINLDTPLHVSEHASEQDPTKLNLKPGQTIAVEDAIKGIVTRSANDAAVVVAENLGGSEPDFAKLMTQKARALGMTRTTYVNASGLPDDDQITTARDQALLGRAIQDRFPHLYKYFSTESFVYHGEEIRTHNHLLGSIEGLDGIKTGFTRASGFNILTSVHRDGRFIVGVVMGGRSGGSRDATMRGLISEHIKEAALHRTAPMIADGAGETREEPPQPIAFARAPMSAHTDAAPTPMVAPAQGAAHGTAAANNDPIKPLLVRTITFRTAPVQASPLTPMPSLVPVAPPAPAPAQVQAQLQAPAPQPAAARTQPAPTVVASADLAEVKTVVSPIQVTPIPPAPAAVRVMAAAKAEPDETDPTDHDPASGVAYNGQAIPNAAPARAHGGWLIQIGAFDDENDAKQHLSDARTKLHSALASADPFTERVQKGDKALYRARFAGFDKATAEAACRQLKRSDFVCMAVRD
jgi:D-alanyl-D-alanine carboxypeptidase